MSELTSCKQCGVWEDFKMYWYYVGFLCIIRATIISPVFSGESSLVIGLVLMLYALYETRAGVHVFGSRFTCKAEVSPSEALGFGVHCWYTRGYVFFFFLDLWCRNIEWELPNALWLSGLYRARTQKIFLREFFCYPLVASSGRGLPLRQICMLGA